MSRRRSPTPTPAIIVPPEPIAPKPSREMHAWELRDLGYPGIILATNETSPHGRILRVYLQDDRDKPRYVDIELIHRGATGELVIRGERPLVIAPQVSNTFGVRIDRGR